MLTQEQKRIKIAEACGWTYTNDTWTSPAGARFARMVGVRFIPDDDKTNERQTTHDRIVQ